MSENDLLAFGAAALGALAVGGLAYALLYPYFAADRETNARVRELVAPKVRDGMTVLEQAASRRKSVVDTLKDMENRQKAAEKISLRLRLERAGLDIKPRNYWLAGVACGIVLAVLVMFLLPSSGTRMFLAAIVGLIGVFGVPRWFVNKLTARRQAKFIAELPNAIDVIVRGMKSGLPLNECLAVVARESEEPLASEFREVIEQQRVGVYSWRSARKDDGPHAVARDQVSADRHCHSAAGGRQPFRGAQQPCDRAARSRAVENEGAGAEL